MNIETIKEYKNVYIVNDIIPVPKNEELPEYLEVQEWIGNGGAVERLFRTEEELQIEAKKEAEKLKEEELKKQEQERLNKTEKIIQLNKLVFANPDGSCTISNITAEMLDENFQLKKDLFKEEYRMVPVSNFPTELREAWTDDFNTDTVDIHNEKAREILLQQIRNSRLPKFAELDIESLRALEDGDIEWLQDIREKKQILRDITNPLKNFVIKKFNCPKTLEKLKELSKI